MWLPTTLVGGTEEWRFFLNERFFFENRRMDGNNTYTLENQDFSDA